MGTQLAGGCCSGWAEAVMMGATSVIVKALSGGTHEKLAIPFQRSRSEDLTTAIRTNASTFASTNHESRIALNTHDVFMLCRLRPCGAAVTAGSGCPRFRWAEHRRADLGQLRGAGAWLAVELQCATSYANTGKTGSLQARVHVIARADRQREGLPGSLFCSLVR